MQVIETLDRRKGFEQSFLWPLPEPDEPQAEEVVAEEPVTGEQEAAEPTWEDQPVRDKLVAVLTYLRSQHNYCLHCGCKVREVACRLRSPYIRTDRRMMTNLVCCSTTVQKIWRTVVRGLWTRIIDACV